jgi:hypothetical protein
VNPSKIKKQAKTANPAKSEGKRKSRDVGVHVDEIPSPPCTPLGSLDGNNGGRSKCIENKKKLSRGEKMTSRDVDAHVNEIPSPPHTHPWDHWMGTMGAAQIASKRERN